MYKKHNTIHITTKNTLKVYDDIDYSSMPFCVVEYLEWTYDTTLQ
ncbi:hypothetical protein [Mycoplasma phocoenae]|nr:hypothetical protein [Mycoplasma phocoenae]